MEAVLFVGDLRLALLVELLGRGQLLELLRGAPPAQATVSAATAASETEEDA
jgi:hypothetical protein